jgi:hypothetical protein
LTLSAPIVVGVQTETVNSPNLVNVWCANQFALTDETVVLRRQSGPCASDAGTDVSTIGDANLDAAEGDVASIDAPVACTDAGDCTNGTICTIGRCVTGLCVFDLLLDCDAGSDGAHDSSPDTNGPNDGSMVVGDGSSFEGSAVIDGSGPDGLAGDGSPGDAPRADGLSGDGSAIDAGAGGASNADGSTDGAIRRDGQAGNGPTGGQSGSAGAPPASNGGSSEAGPSDAFVEGGGCSCSIPRRSETDASWDLLLLALALTRLRRFRSTTVQPKS